MIPVNIAVLKAKLSYYLGQVKLGREVLVMDRSTPVARLVPSTDADESLILTLPTKSPASLKKMSPSPARQRTDSSKLLREERARR